MAATPCNLRIWQERCRLTRENVTSDDPAHPGFSIQTGEQRSRGIEWEAKARLLDAWALLAFYAFTDAEITQDTTFKPGNRLVAVPRHSAGLWTTWQFPSGALKGLGAGFGVRYVGERAGDLDNTFELPDYAVFDASVFYRYGPLAAQVNIKNLTDEVYFTARSRNNVQPGEPRTVLGRLIWNF